MRNDSVGKKILKGLLIAGAIAVAASSPYFAFNLSRNFWKAVGGRKPTQKDPRFQNAFYYLKRKGCLDVEKKNHQIYISLTKEGRQKAGKYLIDELEIKKPKNWDGQYRIVMFDIPNITRLRRDVFRGKLKELGFYRLQQSVWVHPYECKKEIGLLQEFLGLTDKELKVITGKINNDAFLHKFFQI